MKSVAFAALVAVALGQTDNVNDVEANYYVNQFNGVPFPFALSSDTCVPLSLTAPIYYNWECDNDNNRLIQTTYDTDPTCSGTVADTTYINYNASKNSGSEGYFRCDGEDGDEYVSVAIGLVEGLCTTATINTAIGVCVNYDQDTEMKVFCNGCYAELQFYADYTWYTNYAGYLAQGYNTTESATMAYGSGSLALATCTDALYAGAEELRTANADCGYMLDSDGTAVYGQTVGCTQSNSLTASETCNPTMSPTMSPTDGASTLSVFCAMLFTLFVAVLH